MSRIAWESKQLQWLMGVGAENPRSIRRCNTQLEMKRCLKFGSFSYPPLHSFYFCGKTWNKAIVKVLFIWWVVEILTQALQTWHCLNPKMNAPTGFWKNKAACSIAVALVPSGIPVELGRWPHRCKPSEALEWNRQSSKGFWTLDLSFLGCI